MKEYMEAEGTKSKVTDAIMQAFCLDKEASEQCLDFIRNHQEILSDEEFFQYSKLEEYEIEGVSEFVSEEGEYYISIKKSTIFLASLFLLKTIPYFNTIKDIFSFFGIFNLKGSYVKINTYDGYLCIMLEIARNRKRGVDKNLLKRFKGECCNNQLDCKYNENGLCNCRKETVEEICEDLREQEIVKKRGDRYFYIL